MKEDVTVLKKKEIIHGVVELRSDNILIFRPDIVNFKEFNLDVLNDLLEVFMDITEGIPRPYLCGDTYSAGIVTMEELDFMSKHYPSFATKAAMITHSPVAKVLASTYNSTFDPVVRLDAFTTEENAIKWLLQE